MAEVPQHVRKFVFRSPHLPTQDCLEVLIPEVVSPSYGMYTWPCAPVLAQYVWHHRHGFINRTVLEIGAGTALPGIVAAKCGAQVILSDSGQLPKCLRNCQMSCQANDHQKLQQLRHSYTRHLPTTGYFLLGATLGSSLGEKSCILNPPEAQWHPVIFTKYLWATCHGRWGTGNYGSIFHSLVM
ncbi:histone-arginine methyltransferase METTL23 [Cherax quadricarinatus]|uniref:histone-arginine methyltransferase METTL23 n=1 Tax=Cherax quadricarinatus TaxID=27406 RepID=UPI00387E219B